MISSLLVSLDQSRTSRWRPSGVKARLYGLPPIFTRLTSLRDLGVDDPRSWLLS